jgi:hypothetical protein
MVSHAEACIARTDKQLNRQSDIQVSRSSVCSHATVLAALDACSCCDSMAHPFAHRQHCSSLVSMSVLSMLICSTYTTVAASFYWVRATLTCVSPHSALALLSLLLQLICGTGLCLDPALHQYDAVYAGAGCSSAQHQHYLRSLLAVGGVLVAPFKDKLVRAVRTSAHSVETAVLSTVCFSPIVPVPPTVADGGGSPVGGKTGSVLVRPQFKLPHWSPQNHCKHPAAFKDAGTVLFVMHRCY